MVSAPSGAGKSSLVNGLLKLEPEQKLSISFTTRPPRPERKMVANIILLRPMISSLKKIVGSSSNLPKSMAITMAPRKFWFKKQCELVPIFCWKSIGKVLSKSKTVSPKSPAFLFCPFYWSFRRTVEQARTGLARSYFSSNFGCGRRNGARSRLRICYYQPRFWKKPCPN